MGFQTDLLTGIAKHLDDAGAGTWDSTGNYTTGTVITIDVLPPSPDTAIALGLYPVEDGPGTDSVIGCQILTRGKPRDKTSVKDLADAVFDALHGLEAVTLGGIPIIRVWRASGANLGLDGNQRQEATANFYLQLTRIGTHRSD